ncbi:MAG: DUF1835 domain-containing protein [Bacteroidota bacterium]
MNKILHITNGDILTSILKKFHIEGKIITWREMLCEGKTTNNVGSELFWKERFNFFRKTYRITKNRFIEATLKEYRSLCNQKTQDEVVLWFDHDLFCQINMIAVVSWLKNHKKNVQIALVMSDKKDDSDIPYMLSELSEEQLSACYKDRIYLTRDDVEYADYIWQLYCSSSPLRLQTLPEFDSAPFRHLTDAVKAHILRFPTVGNGLNSVENNVLLTVAQHKSESEEALVQQMLQTEKTYGFSDLQYRRIIKNLKSLFQTVSPVTLNKTGEELLHKNTNYYSFMKKDNVYFGGSKKYDFLYLDSTGKLLKL